MVSKIVSINDAKQNIQQFISETNQSHTPIIINSENQSAVLLSLEDYKAIQETLYLSSIPNMKQSIIDGLNTPISECSENLEW